MCVYIYIVRLTFHCFAGVYCLGQAQSLEWLRDVDAGEAVSIAMGVAQCWMV